MHTCDGALEKRRPAAVTDGGAPKSLGVLGTGTVVSRAIQRRHGTAQVAAGGSWNYTTSETAQRTGSKMSNEL